MCCCAGIWRILPLALFLTSLCTHLLKSHNMCPAHHANMLLFYFIFFIRSDAAIYSITICIVCAVVYLSWVIHPVTFLLLGHIWKPGQVVPKSYPCLMHLGFPDAHAMGFLVLHRTGWALLPSWCAVCVFQWKNYHWLVTLLKTIHFPQHGFTTLRYMFTVFEAYINESILISCFTEMTTRLSWDLLRCCIPAMGILSTTCQKNSCLSLICVWLGMYRVWATLQAHLLMTGLAEVVTGLLGERHLC